MGLLSIVGVDSLFSVRAVALVIYAWLAYTVLTWACGTVYNLYFHPLRNFPGSKRWIIFPFLRQIDSIRGVRDWYIHQSHEKYGEVVRGGVDILTFTAPDAWKDIYGHGHAELPKAGVRRADDQVQDIINADAKTHFRYRRAMLPAFSDKALGEQEGLMRVYIDLLMKRLGEIADQKTGNAADMAKFFNFTTFDLIGDLAFGEALGGLEHGGTNVWLDMVGKSIRLLPIFVFLQQYVPGFGAGRLFRRSQNKHQMMVKELVKKRVKNAEYGHRGDFMDQIMRSRGKEQELTDDELAANANILMIAGSETTATLLSGVTYLLLVNPEKLHRVKEEVRAAFDKVEDITFSAASSRLSYTMACLTEALRLYPPVPILIPRETPAGQMTPVAGHLIPGNVSNTNPSTSQSLQATKLIHPPRPKSAYSS